MNVIPVNNYNKYQIPKKTIHSRQNKITFGHYLDDEMERKQSRISELKKKLALIDSFTLFDIRICQE